MLSCVAELAEEELSDAPVGYAIMRAFANARGALVAASVDAPLPPLTFPRRDEFPRLLWLTPPGRRYDRLLERLKELRAESQRDAERRAS